MRIRYRMILPDELMVENLIGFVNEHLWDVEFTPYLRDTGDWAVLFETVRMDLQWWDDLAGRFEGYCIALDGSREDRLDADNIPKLFPVAYADDGKKLVGLAVDKTIMGVPLRIRDARDGNTYDIVSYILNWQKVPR